MTKNVYWSACKVFVIIVWFKWNMNFLDRFKKNQALNFMKIRPVGAELLHTDGGTGRHDEGNGLFS